MESIIKLLYFILPIYFANMAPIFLSKLNFFNKPISKKLLGSHKTWKGFISGCLAGMLVALVQLQFYTGLEIYDYSQPALFGFLLGFGALFGDSFKSFFKRKIRIKPGKPWIPFDQIDYSIGALVFVSPLIFLGWWNSLIIIVLSFLLHIFANHLGYWLGIRKIPW
ncbi:hypothetical protein COV11_04295 [Candidatus Woesearchaeota archaeon CG10_big_fil_rev_8_21_14_0_10_30_7]|nr:MAG: hypothetical protein COV11_04295 [Candidatus Woesearchaeota archaeon CG10_big_fil_rev_8_21_14_0_10_30_7]